MTSELEISFFGNNRAAAPGVRQVKAKGREKERDCTIYRDIQFNISRTRRGRQTLSRHALPHLWTLPHPSRAADTLLE
jgi:hypothetical protein